MTFLHTTIVPYYYIIGIVLYCVNNNNNVGMNTHLIYIFEITFNYIIIENSTTTQQLRSETTN